MSDSIGNIHPYGSQDSSYKAAGEEESLRKLSVDFYEYMENLPEAKSIRRMHEEDLTLMTDKLTLFLCMWLGGPKKYLPKYGSANMVHAHQHLVINEPERDAWLSCMDKAIDQQEYANTFKAYLKNQFRFPAEKITMTSKCS